MQTILQSLRKLLPMVMIGLLHSAAFSQDIASIDVSPGQASPVNAQRTQPLKTFLSALETTYQLSFNYDDDLIEGKSVQTEVNISTGAIQNYA